MTPEAIKALSLAQSEMDPVRKNAQNPHLKNRYADLESCLDAVTPALHKHGFALLQPCGADAFGSYVETTFAHQSGGTFTSRVYLTVDKATMQGVGSAITYARRYGLLGLAGLAPEDDDGNEASKPKPKAAPPKEVPAFDPVAAFERIKGRVSAAATADDLTALWKAEAETIAEISGARPEAHGKLVEAFKARKAALSASYPDAA